MNEHGEHRRRLRAILVSGNDARGAFEASELSRCVECREVVEDHVRLLSDLEDLGSEERAMLGAASRIEAPPGRAEAALRAHVLAQVTGAPPRAAAPVSRRWLAVAAGALVIALALRSFGTRTRGEEPGGVLGDETRLLHPVGPVESYAPFRWNVVPPEGGYFVLRVEGEGFALESERVYGREWTPREPPEWPVKIRWTLEVHRASGPGDLVTTYVEWAEL